MALKRKTAPVLVPFTLDQVKQHLNLPTSYTAQDDFFTWAVKTAVDICENKTNRAILTQTWVLTLRNFPAKIEVNKCPYQEIVSLKYYDTAGELQTLTENTHFVVNDQREPFIIEPAYGLSWPATQDRFNAVQLEFNAGWEAAADVSETLKQGMRLIIGDMYKNRETIVIGRGVRTIPQTADDLFFLERIEDHHTKNYD